MRLTKLDVKPEVGILQEMLESIFFPGRSHGQVEFRLFLQGNPSELPEKPTRDGWISWLIHQLQLEVGMPVEPMVVVSVRLGAHGEPSQAFVLPSGSTVQVPLVVDGVAQSGELVRLSAPIEIRATIA